MVLCTLARVPAIRAHGTRRILRFLIQPLTVIQDYERWGSRTHALKEIIRVQKEQAHLGALLVQLQYNLLVVSSAAVGTQTVVTCLICHLYPQPCSQLGLPVM